MRNNSKVIVIGILLITSSNLFAQTLYLASGASITTSAGSTIIVNGSVQGVAGNLGITGPGTLKMTGTTTADLDMAGESVPVLEIDNTSNVNLTGSTKVTEGVVLTNGKLRLTTALANLTLDPNTSVTGQTAAKFFETTAAGGQVIKELDLVQTNFEVPLGFGANYRPAYITATAVAGTKVGIKNLDGSSSVMTAGITNYLNTNWPVNLTGAVSGLSLGAKYLNGDITGVETVVKGQFYNGSSWNNNGETSDDTQNSISMPVSTSGVLAGFGAATALPLTLLYFQGNQDKENIKLTWQTTNELNVDKFIINKSLDGLKFEAIGEVKATGTSKEILEYGFNTIQKEEIAYYNLKMLDKDGALSNSKIIMLKNGDIEATLMSVSPNPLQNDLLKVKYFSTTSQSANLLFIGTKGELISNKQVNLEAGLNNLEINNLNALPQGVYMIQVKTELGKISTAKVIK